MGTDDVADDALVAIVAQHSYDQAGRERAREHAAEGKTLEQRPPIRLAEAARRQCSLDAAAQIRWSHETQVGVGDHSTHIAIGGEFADAAGAAGDVGFDVVGMTGIEFTIEERVLEDFDFIAGHCRSPFPSAASHAVRSIARARASLDITVPTGTRTMSAISR